MQQANTVQLLLQSKQRFSCHKRDLPESSEVPFSALATSVRRAYVHKIPLLPKLTVGDVLFLLAEERF